MKKQVGIIGLLLGLLLLSAQAVPTWSWSPFFMLDTLNDEAPGWNGSPLLAVDTRDDEAPSWIFSTNSTINTRAPYTPTVGWSGDRSMDTRSWATNIALTAHDTDSLGLDWTLYPNNLQGIRGYDVSWREFGSTGDWENMESINMQATVENLSFGTVYDARVRPIIKGAEQEWGNLAPAAYTEPGIVYETNTCVVYQHAWTHQHGEEVDFNVLKYFSEKVIEEVATDIFIHWTVHGVKKIAGKSISVAVGSSAFGFISFPATIMVDLMSALIDPYYPSVTVIPYYPRQSMHHQIRIFENEPVYVEVFLDLSRSLIDLDGSVSVASYTSFLQYPTLEEYTLIPTNEIHRFIKGYAYRIVPKQPLLPLKMDWNLFNSEFYVQAKIQKSNGARTHAQVYDVSPVFGSEITFSTRGDLSDGGSFAVLCYRDGSYRALFESPTHGTRIGSGKVLDSAFSFWRLNGVTYSGSFSYGDGGVIESVTVNLDDGNVSVWGTGSDMQGGAEAMAMMALAETTYSSFDVPPGLHVMEEGDAMVYILIGTDGNYLVAVSQNGSTESVGGTLNPDGSINATSGDLVFNATWGAGDVFSGSFTLGTNVTATVGTEVFHSANSLHAWYEGHYGTNLVLNSDCLDADDDADGLSCLIEYLCGLDPLTNDAWQASGMEITTNAAGEQAISRWFEIDTDSEAVSYAFAASQSLTNWYVIDPGLRTMEETNGTLRIQYDIPSGTNAAQFIRFKAEVE